MNKRKKIMVIGSSNTDMIVKTKQFPAPGETVIGGTFLMSAGGKGANQAMAAKRLGGEVIYVGKIGDDIFGQQAMQQMKDAGIDMQYVSTDIDTHSGVALITINEEGENNIVVAPGSNTKLSPTDIDRILPQLAEVDIVLLQLEISLDVVEYIVMMAQKQQKMIILNPAPATDFSEGIFKYISILTPNQNEAEKLTGIKVINVESAHKAAMALKNKGVETVIVTMGAAGAYIFSKGFKGLVPTPKVKVVDTTAAGDTFNGALAVALSENQSIFEAVKFACQVASLSVTKIGAQMSIPLRSDVNFK